MANPFAIGAALARTKLTLTCPHCGFNTTVPRKPAVARVCPRCKKQYPDPPSKRRK